MSPEATYPKSQSLRRSTAWDAGDESIPLVLPDPRAEELSDGEALGCG
jgi:hypothetical protein